MITLKTLSDATAQEVFDQVATHLLHQGKRAIEVNSNGNVNCVYHGQHGLKCAAGCLISDSEYSKSMEGRGWLDLSQAGIVPPAHLNLVRQLQNIHDSCESPALWADRLSSLAEELHLKMVHV